MPFEPDREPFWLFRDTWRPLRGALPEREPALPLFDREPLIGLDPELPLPDLDGEVEESLVLALDESFEALAESSEELEVGVLTDSLALDSLVVETAFFGFCASLESSFCELADLAVAWLLADLSADFSS